ncbi:ABC transporter family substrate-binding protein [Tsukamurella soli]|uniref:Oligopeptide ABC transporter substrate-binding protein OppA n=1 Tax=Tsukamurella soli TaxID=644556 RepID=A0ABP8KCV8_9ACTN
MGRFGIRRWRALVAPLAVAALVGGSVAACSSDTPSTGAGAPASFTAQAVINPHPLSDLKQGGNMNWPISQWIANWNYNQIQGTSVDMSQMAEALLPRTFTAAPDGTLSLDTDYFTSITEQMQDGKQVVTYDINPKATWSTGRPIDWTDLAAQWKALNGSNTAYQNSSTTGYEDIASVTRGASDKQAIVTYARPFGDWKGEFSGLEAREVNATPDSFNTGYVSKPVPTAGPFRIRTVDAGAKRVVVERNPGWWGARPVLDTITYLALDSSATIGALQNGEIDFTDLGSSIDAFKVARGLKNVDIRQSAGFQWRHFDFNGAPGRITADPAVRIAIMRAINRDLIARALLGPITSDPTVLNNHIYVAGEKGYQANNGGITFDPDAARKQLDADGWKLDGQFRKKNGKQLDVHVTIPSDTDNAAQESQLIQQNLKDVGINLIIDTVPSDDFLPKYINLGNFDTTIFTWEGTLFPASSSLSIYQKIPGQTMQNYGQIGSAQINALATQVEAELDPAKQIELANRLDALVWQEGHSLPLYQRPYSYATKKNLVNFGATGFGDIDVTKIGWLK